MRSYHASAAGIAGLILMAGILPLAHADANPPADGTEALPKILTERLDHEGFAGTLVICGGGDLPAAGKEAFATTVIPDKPVVVITSASAEPAAAVASATEWLTAAGITEVVTAELSGDREIDRERMTTALRSAGGVWISAESQGQLASVYAGTVVEHELKALLKRGGVIGGTSAGAAALARLIIASGGEQPQISSGLDLLASVIVDPHFFQQNRIGRLRSAVAEHPECIGLGIDAATSVVIQGRSLGVIGEGTATIVLAKSARREAVEQAIPSGAVADLTQLRRAARWRCSNVDPGEPCYGPPEVPQGSLVIVGGGGMPQPIIDRFIQLAGGSQAKIVVLPTAVPRREALRARVPGFLSRADVASVILLPQSRPEEIADERFQRALREATGIWFDGGRQWNFVDAYENTGAIALFHDCLQRGGVIGGSSAGATIQGEYLVRGHPLGNTVMMAEGYERGFAFLPGVAIDQHFSQRRRQRDLIPVIQRHPRLLGIGIDEGTALIVTGSRAEILGEHAVHFLRWPDATPDPAATPAPQRADSEQDAAEENSNRPSLATDEMDSRSPQLLGHGYISVPAGQVIDLRTLQVGQP